MEIHSGYHEILLTQHLSIKPRQTEQIRVKIQHPFLQKDSEYFTFFYACLKGNRKIKTNCEGEAILELLNTTNKVVNFGENALIGVVCAVQKFDIKKISPCNLLGRPHIYNESNTSGSNASISIGLVPFVPPNENILQSLGNSQPAKTVLLPKRKQLSIMLNSSNHLDDKISEAHMFSLNDTSSQSGSNEKETEIKTVKRKSLENGNDNVKKKKEWQFLYFEFFTVGNVIFMKYLSIFFLIN